VAGKKNLEDEEMEILGVERAVARLGLHRLRVLLLKFDVLFPVLVLKRWCKNDGKVVQRRSGVRLTLSSSSKF
jgi:hypothetical protein